ncbi:hypothetical protein F5884DRAFT_689943 [Xylogone sp. PMI_703]|nr:hypothetical protein F5884DRAFT_689943 [Xylogone sp. PMI_703]
MLRLCAPTSRAALFCVHRIRPSILAFHSDAYKSARKAASASATEDDAKPTKRKRSLPSKVEDSALSTVEEPKKTRRRKSTTAKEEKEEVDSIKEPAKRTRKRASSSTEDASEAPKDRITRKPRKKASQSVEDASQEKPARKTRKKASEAAEEDTVPKKRGRKPRKEVSQSEGEQPTSSTKKSKKQGKNIQVPSPDSILDYLQFAYFGDKTSLLGCDNRRINIVSKSLCDDVLEQMKPSLMKHKGCDIIELNPGVGIWSSKLHDLLRPRTHILMEPDAKCYEPYLSKLENKVGSTYKIIPRTGIIWGHLNTAASKEYLPHQEELPRGDPRLEQPNDTLLFVANLGYYPTKQYKGFASVSTLMIHQLLSAARTHALFQRYGLVRMLIWLSDTEKNIILPKTISYRKKFAVEGELTCENIIEVAGAESPDVHKREHHLDLASSRKVQKKMAAANIKVPSRRLSKLQKESSGEVESEAGDDITYDRPYYVELRALEEKFANGVFTQYTKTDEAVSKTAKGRPRGAEITPEYHRLSVLRNRAKWDKRRGGKMEELLHDFETTVAAEENLLDNGPDEDGKVTRESLEQRMEDIITTLDGWNNIERNQFWLNVDNRRAIRNNPPTLLWDRRPSEPLAVHPEEFFPQQNMCLLDFQPRSLWPILRDNNYYNYDYMENILSTLFTTPTQSAKRGLETLAPGALEWLTAECPSLTDPAKGGARNLNHLAVRCLTQEMLKEIMEAWMRWPFRPSRHEMIVRTGTVPYDPTDEETYGPLI